MKSSKMTVTLMAALALGGTLASAPARAHCDTLDGPVVADARAAFAKGDVMPVLKWVRSADEPEIRAAFRQAATVRAGGEDARALADRFFFETLVRVHRAGEGAPYTGLKPAGTPVDAGIRAADEAIEKGSGEAVAREVAEAVAAGVKERYAKVAAAKPHASHNVDTGREYVAAYVDFMHYVEGIHAAAAGPAHHGAHAGPEKPAAAPAAHGH